MKDRLREWWKRFLNKAKEKWLWWVLFIPSALLQDRLMGFLNHKIDEHGTGIMPWIKASFMWIQASSPLGIVGLTFLAVILALIVHAYVETRPKAASLDAGDKVGRPTIIQHPPSLEQKPSAERLREDSRRPSTRSISNLRESGIRVEQKQSGHSLFLFLTNTTSPTPLIDCQVAIVTFKIWSAGLREFSVIGAFDKPNDLLPMRIYGPANLYADDPAVCNFIESNDKEELRIASLEPQRTVVLPKKAGIWCAYMRVQASGKEFLHRVCFEWKPRETLNFVQCPDISLIEL